jgi:single-strand DNA-binding protein
MSRSLNKVTLIGNVGSDPDIRTTPSGTRVAKLSLATNYRYKDRNDQFQDKTEWHRLTFFGRLADLVEQYVSKGDRIYAEGRLEYSQTQDDQGNARYWTDIIVGEMLLLGSGGAGAEGSPGGGGGFGSRSGGPGGSGGSGGGGGSRTRPAAAPDLSEPDDDLPF